MTLFFSAFGENTLPTSQVQHSYKAILGFRQGKFHVSIILLAGIRLLENNLYLDTVKDMQNEDCSEKPINVKTFDRAKLL